MVDNNRNLSGWVEGQVPWLLLHTLGERDALYGIVLAIRSLQFFEKNCRLMSSRMSASEKCERLETVTIWSGES